MKKNLVLFFTIKEFEEVHLYKDVGLVPYYLCKEYDLNGKIVYSNEIKKELPKQFRNLELEEIKFIKLPTIIRKLDKFKLLENINFYRYLLKNAKNIDYLMLFHYSSDKVFLIHLYKFLNPQGKVYIKLDSDGNYNIKNTLKNKIVRFLLKNCKKKVDLFSIETIDALQKTRNINLFMLQDFEKLIHIPNGFDEDYAIKKSVKIKNFEEKENIMITIGRLGTEQKNNELLLEAVERIELKNWKVLLIGPYTEEFKKLYNNFIERNQEKKDKVILVGNISNRELLYDYYNRAKVFILTSRWEGFAIVYPEALRFGNYIITTDVGGARDIAENGKLGSIIEIGNSKQLQTEIEKVINDKIDLKEKYKASLKLSNKKFLWNNIVKNEKFINFFKE